MVFWRKDDVGRLEDALMKFEGRGKFERRRVDDQRNARLLSSRPKSGRKRHRQADEQQLDLL
jgi:hypothetical protein